MPDDYEHCFAQGTTPARVKFESSFRRAERNGSPADGVAELRRLQRLKRLRKTRGLSARQLMERKMNRRVTRRPKPDIASTVVSVRHSAI